MGLSADNCMKLEFPLCCEVIEIGGVIHIFESLIKESVKDG
jgi:hypothetical protein